MVKCVSNTELKNTTYLLIQGFQGLNLQLPSPGSLLAFCMLLRVMRMGEGRSAEKGLIDLHI